MQVNIADDVRGASLLVNHTSSKGLAKQPVKQPSKQSSKDHQERLKMSSDGGDLGGGFGVNSRMFCGGSCSCSCSWSCGWPCRTSRVTGIRVTGIRPWGGAMNGMCPPVNTYQNAIYFLLFFLFLFFVIFFEFFAPFFLFSFLAILLFSCQPSWQKIFLRHDSLGKRTAKKGSSNWFLGSFLVVGCKILLIHQVVSCFWWWLRHIVPGIPYLRLATGPTDCWGPFGGEFHLRRSLLC